MAGFASGRVTQPNRAWTSVAIYYESSHSGWAWWPSTRPMFTRSWDSTKSPISSEQREPTLL